MFDDANKAIRCTVENCSYHCDDKQYCSLDSVKIGAHDSNPTQTENVDCESFKAR